MNTEDYVYRMFNSVSVAKKGPSSWAVTNKVKAYGLPFKVSFDLNFTEVKPSGLPASVVKYMEDEASAIPSKGRSRFLVLDLVNFSQLIYRNYSIVYMKELGPSETLVVTIVVAGVDVKKANSFFNFPPVSTTEKAMMKNLRTQILHMASEIQ
jgi:hypothetical protein